MRAQYVLHLGTNTLKNHIKYIQQYYQNVMLRPQESCMERG